MTDERLDEALKDLRAELSVTPSPEFAAKVRGRIERAPANPSWNVWAWAGVAAACGAAALAVVVWRGFGQAVDGPAPSATVQPGMAKVVVPPAAAAPAAPRVAEAGLRASGTPPASSPAVRTSGSRSGNLDVLVPPDQLVAIRRLMSAVRSGAALNVPPAPALIDPDTGELITPKPIEIPLITVVPLPGDPDDRGGRREDR